MSSAAELARFLFASLPRVGIEPVPLAAAGGRILAGDVRADREYWPFDRAAMDGIAVRASDVASARPDRPVALEIGGSVYCGDDVPSAPLPGAAIRIATGAPLPRDTDAVVPQELVIFSNGTARVARPIAPGKNVFRRGEDMSAGQLVLATGTRLRGAHLAVLAALGRAAVPVAKRVRVAIVACGDELVEPGRPFAGGRVTDTNSYALAAEIAELGAEPELQGIVPDNPQRLRETLDFALGADAVVTCGGLSVGERDFVRETLRGLGARFAFEGAPIAPGHPVAAAFVRDVPVFALPGTPGACRVAFEVFVRPGLLAMMGAERIDRPRSWPRVTEPLDVRPGRTRFIWARLGDGPDGSTVSPLADQGTATIRSASDADALIVLPSNAASVAAGLRVETWLLGEPFSSAHAHGLRAAVAIVGPKNVGKTTLGERLIAIFTARGIRVGAVKRHGHMLALDDPLKDTGRTAAAGATVTLLTGELGYVERRAVAGLSLDDALATLRGVDFALVEGYADSKLAKIRVARAGIASDRSGAAGPIVALVSDSGDASGLEPGVATFSWNEIGRLADYLISRYLG